MAWQSPGEGGLLPLSRTVGCKAPVVPAMSEDHFSLQLFYGNVLPVGGLGP